MVDDVPVIKWATFEFPILDMGDPDFMAAVASAYEVWFPKQLALTRPQLVAASGVPVRQVDWKMTINSLRSFAYNQRGQLRNVLTGAWQHRGHDAKISGRSAPCDCGAASDHQHQLWSCPHLHEVQARHLEIMKLEKESRLRQCLKFFGFVYGRW